MVARCISEGAVMPSREPRDYIRCVSAYASAEEALKHLPQDNPDVILMFDFGLSSLGGTEAVLKMPGVAQTNAGKNKRIVQMDGELLINFSVRLDQAISINIMSPATDPMTATQQRRA